MNITATGYIGRFAPTPSGPLHYGSIIAALGSYLQAKTNNGKWLVRIDDIDLDRAVTGADKIILQQLESLGLFWDGEVVYQSHRLDLYKASLEILESLNCIYPCTCSRKNLSEKSYACHCRNGLKPDKIARSIKIRTNNNEVSINDQLQGYYAQRLETDVGDFIIKRADGYYAYHLATVVDDAEQKITDIVRGVDLLDSTPRQVFLQNKLNLNTPSYLHLPIAIDNKGKKISKSLAPELINQYIPNEILFSALQFLNQSPPADLISSDVKTILDWAIKNWDIKILPRQKEMPVKREELY